MASDQYFLAVAAIQNRLHAYILSLLADPVGAQDVLQETNLVLIRKADDFQSDASFESWAFSTARFQVLAHLRDQKRDRLVSHEAFAKACSSGRGDGRGNGIQNSTLGSVRGAIVRRTQVDASQAIWKGNVDHDAG